MKRKTSEDYQSPQPSILYNFRWLFGRFTAIQCTTFGFCGLYSTSTCWEGILKVQLRKVVISKAFSGTLQSIAVSSLLRERRQRYMGARTNMVAMGVQTAKRQILEGSSWYLSQIAAGMKSSPAMMTRQPWRRAVLVVSRVKAEAFQSGIWLILCSFMRLVRREMSLGVSCFCLKLSRISQRLINKSIITTNSIICHILNLPQPILSFSYPTTGLPFPIISRYQQR